MRSIRIFTFFMLFGLGQAVLPPDLAAFDAWATKYNKTYHNATEAVQRFRIFRSNLESVKLRNGNNSDIRLGLTKFADLSEAEYRRNFLGFRPLDDPRARTLLQSAQYEVMEGPPLRSINWTALGKVVPVKDQKMCGSCWAFAATGAIESLHAIKTGKLVPLSEQQIVDCDRASYNKGCNGGNPAGAFEFVKKVGGLCSSESYPYKARDMSCIRCTSTVGISGMNHVPPLNETALEIAVSKRPIAVAIDASSWDFAMYRAGIMTPGNCGFKLNHAVLLTGFGKIRNTEYWIIKNSWGRGWGENGYARLRKRIRRSAGTCGITMFASYPV